MFIAVGILYMSLGIMGKVSAIFIMIPEPVLGGALLTITGVFIGTIFCSFAALDKFCIPQNTTGHLA